MASAVAALRAGGAAVDEFGDAVDDTDGDAEPRRLWRAGALAASCGGLLLVGTWWVGHGRHMASVADSVLARHPSAGRADAARPSSAAPRGLPSAALPEAYKVLFTRSVFARGGQSASDSQQGAKSHAAGFSLKGISQEDQSFTAFVAESSAGSRDPADSANAAGPVIEVHVGDEVTGGRVREITLEDVAIETDGRIVRVLVGQRFDPAAPAEPQASTR